MKNSFELVHIGINQDSPEDAQKLADLLSELFNLEPRHGKKSEFAGTLFECMRSPFLGENGHIAMATADLELAVAELKEKGFTFNMDTAAYDDSNKLKNIYLNGEFGGFAIHIMQQ
ncbi:2-dehydro-3-deoxyphosphogluconate aldolase [Agrilactobacillus yilanensis]|uniref:2-dehydro-3-deoxyphosphogluconate aldolase n=1 Tax=Agrilactobacillus yilanensis TaxID=2485997 RepID=A0ABW4J3G1_9LACO|nr:2-dehydro-3-deoxyphosphogluconate aldolase [Agrilactobacillus yilanensis]